MLGGTHGKILHVDLTLGETHVEHPPEEFYRLLVGGRAVVAYLLLRDLAPRTEPFSPDNLLIFAPGIMQGTSFPGAGRHGVGGKSPLTGAIASTEAGGWWGHEFKRAGFDGLVVHGKLQPGGHRHQRHAAFQDFTPGLAQPADQRLDRLIPLGPKPVSPAPILQVGPAQVPPDTAFQLAQRAHHRRVGIRVPPRRGRIRRCRPRAEIQGRSRSAYPQDAGIAYRNRTGRTALDRAQHGQGQARGRPAGNVGDGYE